MALGSTESETRNPDMKCSYESTRSDIPESDTEWIDDPVRRIDSRSILKDVPARHSAILDDSDRQWTVVVTRKKTRLSG